jgi:peroxiredoxin (alkyl hydroperoxide reductase subunit C)
VRLVKAMQTSDEFKVATPEAWQPVDKVIVPSSAKAEAAAARMLASMHRFPYAGSIYRL